MNWLIDFYLIIKWMVRHLTLRSDNIFVSKIFWVEWISQRFIQWLWIMPWSDLLHYIFIFKKIQGHDNWLNLFLFKHLSLFPLFRFLSHSFLFVSSPVDNWWLCVWWILKVIASWRTWKIQFGKLWNKLTSFIFMILLGSNHIINLNWRIG
jgi:hypothetical protein